VKVLLAHVRYRHRGGEDQVFEDEFALLRAGGVDVSMLDIASVNMRELGARAVLGLAFGPGDHEYGRALIRAAIAKHQPDVVHFHNIYPLLGVGAMREARSAGSHVVRTYHNYRLSCVAGTHFYGGAICERCAPGRRAPGVLRGCYRGSRVQSVVMAAACDEEWQSLVSACLPDIAVCPSTFARDKLTRYGLPESRVVVKPNSREAGQLSIQGKRSGALFVGRLSPEKGIMQLLDAWGSDAPALAVAGDGPLMSRLTRDRTPNVFVLGRIPESEVRRRIARVRVVVVPSLAYEVDSLAVSEALAEGTPVVCFDHGALSTIGTELSTACVVPTGDFRALSEAAQRVARMPSAEWALLSERARDAFERNHTPEGSFTALLAVYRRLLHAG
jgi:glycosyltransferase involved in cell wall biosynthesis